MLLVYLLKVGILGCGAIGATISHAIKKGDAGNAELIVLCDMNENTLNKLYDELDIKGLIKTTKIKELIYNEEIDLIIEAASQKAVKLVAKIALESKKNLLIMSVGAFADTNFFRKIENIAKKNNVKIFIPSGALCGLDAVKSASIRSIDRVQLISTKNPKSLMGQPYLLENNIDISNLRKSKIIFDGNAKDAAKGFPKSVNVAVSLSLAGIGVEKTRVTVIADPEASRTQHEIKVEGSFGNMYSRVENILHPENPRTS